jgi:hypothetical protein
MKDLKIDFSVLDPSKDKERWEGLVRAVATRAHTARARRLTVGAQMVAWARPALALAAALALVSCAARFALPAKGATITDNDSVATLASWAAEEQIPATADILEIFGGHDGTE